MYNDDDEEEAKLRWRRRTPEIADGRRQGVDDAIAYNSPSRMMEGDISRKAVNELAFRPSWRLLASNSSMRRAEGRITIASPVTPQALT